MSDKRNKGREEIKLEELLRFKRSERPDQTFWNKFDCQLHQRMLQTLIKKKPWHLQLANGFTGLILQFVGFALAATVIMMLVVRPSWVVTAINVAFLQENFSVAKSAASMQVTMVGLPQSFKVPADYQIDAISASEAIYDPGFEHYFGVDAIQVAVNSDTDYSDDSVLIYTAFGDESIASLVF